MLYDESISIRAARYKVEVNSKTVHISMPLREAKLIMTFLNYIEQRRDLVFGRDLSNGHLGTTPRALETALRDVAHR